MGTRTASIGYGLVDSSRLTDAKVTMGISFEKALKAPRPLWYERITSVLPSGGKSTKHPIMGGLTGLREWTGERVYEDISRYAYELVNKTFEKTVGIDVDDIEDDQLGGYNIVAEEFGQQCALWPQAQVSAALLANGLCFDGQNFFDTDHPVDLNTPSLSTYANSFTGTALTNTNLNTVISTMSRIPGRDGQPAGFGASGQLLLVVPPQLRKTAAEILNAETIKDSDANPHNVMKGAADLLVLPELGGAATTWYLFDVGHVIKPFIFQLRKKPTIITLASESDQNVFNKNQAVWGCKARGAAGYGIPWTAAKAVA